MYEIFCTITDELGSRTAPTGHAAFLEVVAHDKLDVLQRTYPDDQFWVEWVPAADAWNSY